MCVADAGLSMGRAVRVTLPPGATRVPPRDSRTVSKARRKAMTPDQRKKESQARAERRRRSKQLAANEPAATTE